MAKMKQFAVTLAVTKEVTVYVNARRPNGAIDRLYTEEGWREATAYNDSPIIDGDFWSPPKGAVITNIREV